MIVRDVIVVISFSLKFQVKNDHRVIPTQQPQSTFKINFTSYETFLFLWVASLKIIIKILIKIPQQNNFKNNSKNNFKADRPTR